MQAGSALSNLSVSVVWAIGAAWALSLPVALSATTSVAGSDAQQLSQLEDRLFEHNYPDEDDAARLHRLDQFVFGDDQSGSVKDRLSHLESVVVEDNPANAGVAGESSTPAQSSQQVAAAPAQSSTAAPAFDYGSYPRVAAIEKQLLGTTYDKDPLPERVARLETKAFGQASTSNDLGQRVDLLDQYAHRHDLYHEADPAQQMASNQQILAQGPGDSQFTPASANPFAPGNQLASGTSQRAAIMETAVFGRSYPNRPLEQRVEKLEKKMIPYERDLAKKSLPVRVDHLWSILSAANTLNSPSSVSDDRNSGISANQTYLASRGPANNAGVASTGQDAGAAQSGQTNNAGPTWLHKMSRMISSSQAVQDDNSFYQPSRGTGPWGGAGPLGGSGTGTYWLP